MPLIAVRSSMRAMLREASTGLDDVLIPYAGDLTLARTVRASSCHGADLNLYAVAIAARFTGQELELTIRAEQEETFGWLGEYLDTPIRAAAAVSLARFLRAGETPYHRRIQRAYRDQWPRLFPKAVGGLERAVSPLASFDVADPLEWLLAQDDRPAVTAPPISVRYRDDLTAHLADIFSWPREQPLSGDRAASFMSVLCDRPAWLAVLQAPDETLSDQLLGKVQGTPTAAPSYLYGTTGHARLVRPRQELERALLPRLGLTDLPGAPLELRPIPVPLFASLRSRYLNPHIAPSTPRLACAVLAGGKLVGCYGLRDPGEASGPPSSASPSMFLLSDFPVAPAMRGLAKLVLGAALSRESQLLIEARVGHRVRGLTTAAYSDRPVSMKYRGLFDLWKRTETPADRTRYTLSYAAPLGAWSLDDALGRWLTSFAKEQP
jgi:hypothetical protein